MNRLPDFQKPEGGSEGQFSPNEGEDHTKKNQKVHFLDPPDEDDLLTAELLDAFYMDAQKIHLIIIYIQDITDALDEIHAENIFVIDPEKSLRLRKEIAQRSAEVTAQLKVGKEGLENLSQKTEELKKDPQSIGENSAVIRIQENFYFYLVRRLNQAMMEYQRKQSIHQEKYKAQTKRQIQIKYTKPDGTSIDDQTAQQLTEQVLANRMSDEIFQQSKNLLASITETRNDIYRIEQSIRDLNQIFNEMAILVNEQGGTMDIILMNLQTTSKYLEKGRRELKRGRKYQKKSRKKLYCMLACAAIACILVAVIIFVKLL